MNLSVSKFTAFPLLLSRCDASIRLEHEAFTKKFVSPPFGRAQNGYTPQICFCVCITHLCISWPALCDKWPVSFWRGVIADIQEKG